MFYEESLFPVTVGFVSTVSSGWGRCNRRLDIDSRESDKEGTRGTVEGEGPIVAGSNDVKTRRRPSLVSVTVRIGKRSGQLALGKRSTCDFSTFPPSNVIIARESAVRND